MRNSKRTAYIGVLFALTLVLLIVADYANFFSRVGVHVSDFNLDFISIVVGNGVVILLFIIAYVLIDSRNIAKERNKRRTVLGILQNTYEHCARNVDLYEEEDARQSAAGKCARDKVLYQDPMHMLYRNLPFADNNETIIDFAKDGVLLDDEVRLYFLIKKKFQRYIDFMLIFPDEKNYQLMKPDREELLLLLENALTQIQKELSNDNE